MICPSCQRKIEDNSSFCPICGRKIASATTRDDAVINHAYAGYDSSPSPATDSSVKPFSTGGIVGLAILSFCLPIVGYIIGGVNLKHPARKSQAQLILVLSAISSVIGIFSMIG